MDRLIVYPASIPLDTDVLSPQRNAMIAMGYMMQAAFGTGTIVDGLACTPTTPAGMSVNVGPGSIMALSTIDANAFGSLAADTDPLVKMGINAVGVSNFPVTAPATSGQSIDYLLEAALEEADGTPIVLPYYNAANPSVPYSGPGGGGAQVDTVRAQKVHLTLKAGVAATTGTQVPPAVDAGNVPLYVITVAYGATTVIAGNIVVASAAPFLATKIPTAANINGSSAETFAVADATTGAEAVPLGQAQTLFAALAGLSTQAFNVANATTGTEAVALGQFVNSLGANGYAKLPNGLIIQWGQGTATTGYGDSFAFPLSFPNAPFVVIPSEAHASGTWGSGVATWYGTDNLSATGFACWSIKEGVGNSSGITFNYIAVGH